MQKIFTVSAICVALAGGAASAWAQTPPPPVPAHHGIFGKIFHPRAKPGQPVTSGIAAMHGGFVGNKNSHVYHLPGDKGALPAAQNRVYFASAAAAEAAGYHRAGSPHSIKGHSTMPGHSMMPGSPVHGVPMHERPLGHSIPGATTR